MTDVVWGEPIKVNGAKPGWLAIGDEGMFENTPDNWLGPDRLLSYSWGVDDNGDKGCPISIRLPADHPHYAQPSPADTVTIARMTEAEASAYGRDRGYGDINSGAPADCHYYGAMHDLGLIRPATKAERIAKSTNLPLADVEAVLAAMGEGE